MLIIVDRFNESTSYIGTAYLPGNLFSRQDIPSRIETRYLTVSHWVPGLDLFLFSSQLCAFILDKSTYKQSWICRVTFLPELRPLFRDGARAATKLWPNENEMNKDPLIDPFNITMESDEEIPRESEYLTHDPILS